MSRREHVQACIHTRTIVFRHENDDRIRTVELCETCRLEWSTCLAKRLDPDGHEAWGKPGVLHVSGPYPAAERR